MRRRRVAERRCPKCGRKLSTKRFNSNGRCMDCHNYGSPEAARRAARKRMREVNERKKRAAEKKRKWRPPTGAVMNQKKRDWSECT